MLAQQAPPKNPSNPMQHELPPLTVDGIPTPVDKMTQVKVMKKFMMKYFFLFCFVSGKMKCMMIWKMFGSQVVHIEALVKITQKLH